MTSEIKTIQCQSQEMHCMPWRRRLLLMAASIAMAPIATLARAHGLPKPAHSGITATALDLGFEIYFFNRRIAVYVTDHDSPFDTKAFQAEVKFGNRIIPLTSVPGAKFMSADIIKKPNLKFAVLTLRASVLPNPVIVDFRV